MNYETDIHWGDSVTGVSDVDLRGDKASAWFASPLLPYQDTHAVAHSDGRAVAYTGAGYGL